LSLGCSSEGGHDDGDIEVNCDIETRSDTFAAGMSKLGASGMEFVLVGSNPTPPSKGDNTWTIQVLDGSTPADSATVGLVPFMPDHGHGTSKTAVATATGEPGTFEISPVNLWMPGLWEVTVDAQDGASTDQVVFSFCIDG